MKIQRRGRIARLGIALLTLMIAASSLFVAGCEKRGGAAAKNFTVYDLQRNEIELSDHFGKPIVVNFWATWCPPCRAELPAFNAAYQKYGDEVVFLMINLEPSSDVGEVVAFLSRYGYSFPVYYDFSGSAATAYAVSSIPETVFIDAKGRIDGSHVGSMTETALEVAIKRIL